MDHSARIKLIKDIANKLSAEEWALVDLTLGQFGLPTTDQWNGAKANYVIEMVQSATDQNLIDLASHLKIVIQDDTRELPLSAIEMMDLIREIETQKTLMIAVATGGPRIQQVDDEYKARRKALLARLQAAGIVDPNPFPDLWSWYNKWSDGSLPSYQSRRNYISTLYQPVIDRLIQATQQKGKSPSVEPTGWARVDRNIDKIAQALANAKNEEDFQTVGLLCREGIISLAQAVYDPSIHLPTDAVKPSETDAKRMLESYIATALAGGANEELRRFAKDGYQLAVTLQHKRTATFREAALCLEATRSLINIVAIINGIRDPS